MPVSGSVPKWLEYPALGPNALSSIQIHSTKESAPVRDHIRIILSGF